VRPPLPEEDAVRALLIATAATAVVLLPAPAVASCAADADVTRAAVVFVGTAQETSNGHTRFAVGEVWAGPDLAPQVWVRTGQEQPGWPEGLFTSVSMSTDASPEDGERYLVGASAGLSSDGCSMTSSIEQVPRPAAVREPAEEGLQGSGPPRTAWETTAGGAVVVAVAATGVVLVRRRRARAVAGRR